MACIPQRSAEDLPPNSSAEPPDPNAKPEFSLGADVLEQRVAQLAGGYSVAGTYDGTLEKFKALELELARGQCYLLVLRLGKGASFGAHARRGVEVITAYELEDMLTHKNAIVGPGVVLDAGCPLVKGHLVVDLQATWHKEKDTTRFHELGEGPYSWMVYTSPISEAELSSLQAAATGAGAGGAERSATRQPPAARAATSDRAQSRNVQIRNDCAQRVSVFFGKEPKAARGDLVSLEGRTVISKELLVGDSVWLVDAAHNGMGIVNVTNAIRRITISKDCIGISGK